jgi:hypothetical protein
MIETGVSTFSKISKLPLAMALSKNSQGSASAPTLCELPSMQRERQIQRQLQQESRSSAQDSNEESGYLLRSPTAAAAPRGSHHTSRSMDSQDSRSSAPDTGTTAPGGPHRTSWSMDSQDSRSSAPDNEESGYLFRSSTATAAPRGSHRTSRSMDTVLSILRRAVAVLDESDEETEDSVISNRRDDSNSQP